MDQLSSPIVFGYLLLHSIYSQAENEMLHPEVLAIRYAGSLNELETSLTAAGYTVVHSFSVKNGDLQHPWKIDMNLFGTEWCLRDVKSPRIAKKCVYAIRMVLERTSHGYPKFKTEDALEFVPSQGFKFLDEDVQCMDKMYPNRSVLSIGSWKDRMPPEIGGYADSIKQSWILDPETKKFVEISSKDVVCEINEDRD
ncbi:hypothetical protein GALL_157020 [mine drainage metagenome]|uniref:Uncharacterized protein n=1 Tax=mine drainage metagenome TaxID=410659 RepID=A0A1J5S2N1_9ZZZZ